MPSGCTNRMIHELNATLRTLAHLLMINNSTYWLRILYRGIQKSIILTYFRVLCVPTNIFQKFYIPGRFSLQSWHISECFLSFQMIHHKAISWATKAKARTRSPRSPRSPSFRPGQYLVSLGYYICLPVEKVGNSKTLTRQLIRVTRFRCIVLFIVKSG